MTGLIVDNFAGGGGASTGIEAALGRAVDIAINHDEEAIRMHEANHPGTVHIRNNIWQVDPREVVRQTWERLRDASSSRQAVGEPKVSLAWFSPDCKHFSKAKGGKPREKSIRDLAWVVVLWAQRVKPDLILLENVEEFRTWGPLCEEGKPIKERQGETFAKWCKELRKAGYKLQFRELRACDYGAPTIRKRFFMIARCDGKPIVWPEPTHGKPDSAEVLSGKRKPWRTAAEIIDWSIPCPSIFERKKPLAEKTLRRIAHGIMKFVAAHIEQANGSPEGEKPLPGRAADAPLSTIVQKGCTQRLVTSNLVKLRGTCRDGQSIEEPLHTVSAGGTHMGEVRAFLLKYYGNESEGHDPDGPLGTVTTKDRFGLVTVTIEGEEYVIVDIGMRMLTPRELFNAQGFPPDYVIDVDAHGKPITKTAQVAKCGNSVCPPLAEALVRANMADAIAEREREAA